MDGPRSEFLKIRLGRPVRLTVDRALPPPRLPNLTFASPGGGVALATHAPPAVDCRP
jgi:hypothetical protein